MKLYYIRHGQSEANFAKIHSGWSPVHLTEKGIEDAMRAREILKDMSFDKIYASDLTRAIETCEIALPGREYEKTDLIREINVGFLAGRPVIECEKKLGESYIEDRTNFDFVAYEGESYHQFRDRIALFLKSLESSPYESVAAVCHGGVIQTTIDIITGFRVKHCNFTCSNCSVTVFEYKNGVWSLNLWNYTGEI